MKVFIYQVENTLHAIADDMSRPAVSELGRGGDAAQEDVLVVRDLVKIVCPRAKIVWVPGEHPELAALLEAEFARDNTEQEVPIEVVGKHICGSCAHQTVCSGAAEADRIGFTISTCESDVQLPETEDHDR